MIKEAKYILGIIFISALTIGAVNQIKSHYVVNLRYGEAYSDKFFQKIQGTDLEGCLILSTLNPDLLIVGDSHTYAGINFLELGNLLPNQTFSSCAIGGFYFQMLDELIDQLEEQGYVPKKIWYMTSPRQFADSKNINRVREQLFSKLQAGLDETYGYPLFFRDVAEFLQRNFQNILVYDNQQSKNQILQEYSKKISSHQEIIDKLDVNLVNKYLFYNKNNAFKEWHDQIKVWSNNANIENQIANFCELINNREIQLSVIHIPESPALTEMYSDKIKENYNVILDKFNRCAMQVINEESKFYGIDNRFYLNRHLYSDYPYYEIAKPDSEIPPDGLYDLDHLNGVGASIFTNHLVSLLGDVDK